MLIGITGAAGSGKDTAAAHLVAQHFYQQISFAGPLKAGLAAMGFPEPADRDQKEDVIPGFAFSWREAVQKLGTEWGRALDPEIWLKVISSRIEATPTQDFVLSDVRFENEATMIRAQGGLVVHLLGRNVELGTAATHLSEAGVDIQDGDWVIENTGTLEALYAELDDAVAHLDGAE